MSEPNIYEAITAVATALTAIPAAAGAYFAWLQARQYVLVESSQTITSRIYGQPKLLLQITLRNRRRASIQPWFIEINGLPDSDIFCVGGIQKAATQPRDVAPFLDTAIPPGESRDFEFEIFFDWPAALTQAKAQGGKIRWEVDVSFNDRAKERKRWHRRIKSTFDSDQLARHTTLK